MPTTPAALRLAADQADRDAAIALDVVADLERQRFLLEHRLTPVLDRHRADVWASRAATESRRRLQVDAAADLRRARAAIHDVVEQVRHRADVLAATAIDHRRAALRLEVAAAAEVIPPGTGHPLGTTPTPVPPPPVVPVGVR